MRTTFAQLSLALIYEGKRDKAFEVLKKAEQELPEYNIPLTYQSGAHVMAKAWDLLGEKKIAAHYIHAVSHHSKQYIDWYQSLSPEKFKSYEQAYRTHLAVLYYLEQIG
jgi:hypothetical protein